tara:strand:+ start:351 stop:1040 length:690 start_codon:yes stop_codon:yes gene_type:complete
VIKRVPPAPSPTPGSGSSRGARRKLATRNRLLDAGFALMADKGVDGLTIKEITDAADVGFGSFYNHFESKEALHAAIIERQFASHADALDRLVEDVEDPAEVIAISVRHTLLRAEQEPVWGRFLAREGFSAASVSRGLGRRLLRDIGNGIEAGRFSAVDPHMSFLFCGGGVLAAVSAGVLPDEFEGGFESFSPPGRQLPERVAAAVLRVLGVPPDEADTIVCTPLRELA